MRNITVCIRWAVLHLYCSLRWRHNRCDSVSNHQPHDCLLNRLFRSRSKKTSKLRVTGLCAGNSLGTGEFPAQMASNAENVSIWWRHNVYNTLCSFLMNLLSWSSCHQSLNRLRSRQNCRSFSDDIFNCIFLNENVWISLKVSLKFVFKVRIRNIPALVQINGLVPTSYYLKQWWLVYWCIYVSLGLNELSQPKGLL